LNARVLLFLFAAISAVACSKETLSPRQVALRYTRALLLDGDIEKVREFATVESNAPIETDLALEVLIQDTKCFKEIQDACAKRLGETTCRESSLGYRLTAVDQVERAISAAPLEQQGDTAIIRPSDMEPIVLRRSGRSWKVVLNPTMVLGSGTGEFRKLATERLAFQRQQIDRLRAGILDGTISPDEAVEAIVFAGSQSPFRRAQMDKALLDIHQFKEGLGTYKLKKGRFPRTSEGLQVLYTERILKGALPKDPWGKDYIYLYPGLENPNGFDILSYGPDGRPGGGDDVSISDLPRK
jgi:type II secretion system protein G